MISVEVQYFARLRELAGRPRETVQTVAATPGELYEELKTKYAIPMARQSLKVALNDDFADWATPLSDGDRVVFLPPVAGG